MYRLKCSALSQGPLYHLHVTLEVHAGEIDVDELGGIRDHINEVLDEIVTPLFLLRQRVVAEVKVLYLLAILTNDLHDF